MNLRVLQMVRQSTRLTFFNASTCGMECGGSQYQ